MQSDLISRNEKLHVGVIMDGNGRWATRRGLSRMRGHEAGVEAIRRIVEVAPKQGIGTLTLYAFSTDNWRRPKAEVAALMTLLRFYLANEVQSLVKNGVRLTVIGPPRPPARRHRQRDRARRGGHRARQHASSAHRRRLFRPRCHPQRGGEGGGADESHPRSVLAARHRRSRFARRRSHHPHLG
ncbi:undecaprenyl pyrophosphate synthase [Bradyrhizobium sp. LM2.9]